MFDIFNDGWGVNITNSPAYESAARFKNRRADMVTFSRYGNIAAHRFEIEGCPPTINERVVRESLLWYPLTSFFTIGDNTLCLPSVPGGAWFNAYGDFGDGYAYAKNGRVYRINYKIPGSEEEPFLNKTVGPRVDGEFDGVCIRENDMCVPFIYRVIFYVDQVSDTLRAVENARMLMKHPIGVWSVPEQKKSWEEIFKKINDNIPLVFFNKNKPQDGRDTEKVDVVNFLTGGDIIKPTLETLDWWEQRFLAECGVGNMGSQVDKKGENMIQAEVHSSDDVTQMVTTGLVDYINNQLEAAGVHELPGCENMRAVERKTDDEDVFGDDTGEQSDVPGDDDRGNETDDL